MIRKITSKKDESKKRKRNQILVGGILIFVMLFSTLGYAFQGFSEDGNKKIKYGDKEFYLKNGFWILQLGDFTFGFRTDPRKTEKIDSQLNYLSHYTGNPLYIYSENNDAETEISLNLQQTASRIQRACLNKEKCSGDLPLKTCEDNFVIIEESENSEIVQQDNCVFIRGSPEELLKLTDSFLLKIIGI